MTQNQPILTAPYFPSSPSQIHIYPASYEFPATNANGPMTSSMSVPAPVPVPAPVFTQTVPVQVTSTITTESEESTTIGGYSTSTVFWIVIVIYWLLLLLAIGIILYLIYRYNKNNKYGNPVETKTKNIAAITTVSMIVVFGVFSSFLLHYMIYSSHSYIMILAYIFVVLFPIAIFAITLAVSAYIMAVGTNIIT